MSGLVRPARREDAPGVAACHVACWREAYAHLLDPEFLAGFDSPERGRRWAAHLTAPGSTTAVAPAGEEVVGFARTGPSRDEPPVTALELQALYLRAEHHGSGLADRLLEAVAGSRPASLWVFADNPRARAFYAKHGFVPEGSRRPDPLLGIAELRLVRGLSR